MAIAEINDKDFEDILEVAQKFNGENNITGCLLFHNQEFLQILEGDKQVVLFLFERIKKDKRHTHVSLITQGEIQNRSFTGWNLAFQKWCFNTMADVKNVLSLQELENLVSVIDKPTTAKKMFAHIAKGIIDSNKRFM